MERKVKTTKKEINPIEVKPTEIKATEAMATEAKSTEATITIQQACILFCLTNTTRTHVLKKFKDKAYTTNEWVRIFREENVTT